MGEKSKETQLEQTIQLEEMNKRVLAKEGRLKRYRHRIKHTHTNLDIPNQPKKIPSKTYEQSTARQAKQFWGNIWERRDDNKAEWINKSEKSYLD